MVQRGKRAELLLYVGTVLFAVAMLWSAAHLRFRIRGTIGPGLYPTVVLVLIGLVTTILLVLLLKQREVRIIAPFLEGLEKDALLRHLCGALSRRWGRRIRVQTKTGVGRFSAAWAGTIAPTDGNTLVVLVSDTPDLPNLHAASFALAHFEPLARLYFDPDVMLVRPEAPWPALEALRSAGPLRIGLAHHPAYTSSLREWLTERLGLTLLPTYDEDPKVILSALEAGNLDLAMLGLGDAREELAAGRLRALAAASDEPVAASPPLPTFAGQGHPLTSGRWAGLFAPQAVDAATRAQLEHQLLEGLAEGLVEPEAQSLMTGLEAEWHPEPSQAFRTFLLHMDENRRQIEPASEAPQLPAGKYVGLMVTIAGVLVFPALMGLAGFPLAAFVFLAGLMGLLWPRLDWRIWMRILPVSLVLAAGLYWLFWHVFYVVFPSGLLSEWWS